MPHRPTSEITSIVDLARIADVSVSTVSRALTGKGKLSKETRERIQALADEHGFRMNVAAQNLRLGRTGTIGIVVPLGHESEQHLSDPFFMTMLTHLIDRVSRSGYELLFSRVVPKDTDWLQRFIDSRRTDGIIMIGQSDQIGVIEAVAAEYPNLVVWGAGSEALTSVTVGTDNMEGGRLAAEHLLARGRKKLAFFGNPDAPEFAHRYQGFLGALPADAKAAHLLYRAHLTPEAAYEGAVAFLTANADVDGVFCVSDVVAANTVRALHSLGRAIPDAVSVVGFDDMPIATYSLPPLTTIRQEIAQGADAICELLLRRMNGEAASSLLLPPTLVVRGSS